MFLFVLSILCGVLVVFIDQFTKYLVVNSFTLGQSKEFINGLIKFVYIHNRGGAWGVFSGKTWFLVIFTAAVIVMCIVIMFLSRNNSKIIVWAMALTVSGGIGNLIDRIFRDGNVVDFLQFDFWKTFPVFNIADIAVVVGVGLIALYYVMEIIKEYKENKQKLQMRDNNEGN